MSSEAPGRPARAVGVRETVIVDCAGGPMGGALRFRNEMDAYLARRAAPEVRVVGRNRRLSPTWLVGRESTSRYRRAIALNNVSFVLTRAERWVLLRNLTHFLSPDEEKRIVNSTRISRSIPVVRACARRADVLVVPTTEMAERVASIQPELSSRLVVRMHPLSVPSLTSADERQPHQLLCPVIFAPFKAMGPLLRLVDQAAAIVAEESGINVEIITTATERDVAVEGLTDTRHLRFVGRLTPQQLARYQRICRALIYPTRTESFGYPLAEARLARMPVVARDTARAREVAGSALVPYQREDPAAVAAAIHQALRTTPKPEPSNPFDPDRYFDWLLGSDADRR